MKDVGLDVEWQVIYGREEFFNATKLMHNALQGNPQDLTEEQWDTWQRYNEMNARELVAGLGRLPRPRPAAGRDVLARARRRRAAGCGAATSTSRRRTRRRSSGCCPTSRDYPAVAVPHGSSTCPPGMDGTVNIVPPAIDPLAPKNMALSPEDAVVRLRPVRHRRRPAADVPGLALRPVEGPARRDRRLPDRQGGDARRAARARRLDGLRRPRGLGLLQRDDRPRRRRPGHPHPQQLQQRRRDRGQRLPVARRRRDPEVDARGLRPDRQPRRCGRRGRSSAATSAASRCRWRTAISGYLVDRRRGLRRSARSTSCATRRWARRSGARGKEHVRRHS